MQGNRPVGTTRRKLAAFLLNAAIGLSMAGSSAKAQQFAKRVGSETMVGGTTFTERAAQHNALRAQLKARMPAGTMDMPIRIELTPKDRVDLAAQPQAIRRVPLRIGMTKTFEPRIEKVGGKDFRLDFPGQLLENPDGGFTWAAAVSSPGAQAIRVRSTDFSLPPGAALYSYSLAGSAHGPYVGKVPPRHGA